MAADVAGFSTLMGASEADTLARLALLREILQKRVDEKSGRIFSTAGDGFLAEFASPVSAVRAGFDIQRDLAGLRRDDPQTLQLRIGIHLADVVVENDDLLGDGVNIAARIEAEAEPGSVVITQAVFDQVKRTAQLTFENRGEATLKNISDPVSLYRVVDEMSNHSYITGTLAPPTKTADTASVNHNSIAVLPFANMSGDPEQEYFADGFSEDLITELARFRDLFVVSRNASFGYRGRNVDLREVGRALGVAPVLEGSVRKMGNRVRITSQLIATADGEHIWADRVDCALDDIFDMQDQLAASIVATVVGRMELTAAASARRKKPADMAAYDCLMRGLEFHRLGGVTREYAEQAVDWLDRAIALDPDYGRAHAWRACAVATVAEWTGAPDWFDECAAAGARAIELDDNEAESHRIMGSVSMYNSDYDRAEYHFRRALSLNPNHAYIVGRAGELYNFLGDGEKALEMQRRAQLLDPFLPEYCRELEAVALYVLERYAEAVQAVARLPRLTRRATAYRAAATIHLDDPLATASAAAEVLRIDPAFTAAGFVATESYKDHRFKEQLAEDLVQAGLPA
jgi:TolB-like protein